MKLKANDTLFISSVSPENIPPKGEFTIDDDVEARRLIAAGLAIEVKTPKPAAKKAAAPKNKAAPRAKNKSR